MAENYHPQIIGVEHTPHNMDLAKQVIDELKVKGITRIAFEESTFRTRKEYVDSLNAVIREPGTNTLTNNTLIEIRNAVPKEFNPGGFFERLKKYAQEQGIQVKSLESNRIHRLDQLLTWRAVRDYLQKGGRINTRDPREMAMQLSIITSRAMASYPVGYFSHPLRSRKMISIVRKEKPQAIFLGVAHALDVTRAFKMRAREATWIHQKRLIRPTMHAAKNRYGWLPSLLRVGYRIQRNMKKAHAEKKARRRPPNH